MCSKILYVLPSKCTHINENVVTLRNCAPLAFRRLKITKLQADSQLSEKYIMGIVESDLKFHCFRNGHHYIQFLIRDASATTLPDKKCLVDVQIFNNYAILGHCIRPGGLLLLSGVRIVRNTALYTDASLKIIADPRLDEKFLFFFMPLGFTDSPDQNNQVISTIGNVKIQQNQTEELVIFGVVIVTKVLQKPGENGVLSSIMIIDDSVDTASVDVAENCFTAVNGPLVIVQWNDGLVNFEEGNVVKFTCIQIVRNEHLLFGQISKNSHYVQFHCATKCDKIQVISPQSLSNVYPEDLTKVSKLFMWWSNKLKHKTYHHIGCHLLEQLSDLYHQSGEAQQYQTAVIDKMNINEFSAFSLSSTNELFTVCSATDVKITSNTVELAERNRYSNINQENVPCSPSQIEECTSLIVKNLQNMPSDSVSVQWTDASHCKSQRSTNYCALKRCCDTTDSSVVTSKVRVKTAENVEALGTKDNEIKHKQITQMETSFACFDVGLHYKDLPSESEKRVMIDPPSQTSVSCLDMQYAVVPLKGKKWVADDHSTQTELLYKNSKVTLSPNISDSRPFSAAALCAPYYAKVPEIKRSVKKCNEILKLCQVDSEMYFNIICQIVACYYLKDVNQVVLKVWDGTKFPRNIRPIDHYSKKKVFEDENLSEIQDFCVDVYVHDEHRNAALKFSVHDVVRLNNVHAVSRRDERESLILVIHGGRNFQRGISPFDPHSDISRKLKEHLSTFRNTKDAVAEMIDPESGSVCPKDKYTSRRSKDFQTFEDLKIAFTSVPKVLKHCDPVEEKVTVKPEADKNGHFKSDRFFPTRSCSTVVSGCKLVNHHSTREVLSFPVPFSFCFMGAVINIYPKAPNIMDLVKWYCRDCQLMCGYEHLIHLKPLHDHTYRCKCYKNQNLQVNSKSILRPEFNFQVRMCDKHRELLSAHVQGSQAETFFRGYSPVNFLENLDVRQKFTCLFNSLCQTPQKMNKSSLLFHCKIKSCTTPAKQVMYNIVDTKLDPFDDIIFNVG